MKPLFVFILLLFLPTIAFATSTVVINEVLPDPSGDDKEYEWVELYNLISTNTSLNGYVLEDKNRKRITLSGEISKWLVIYPKGLNGFALTNTGSTLKLFTASDSAEPIDTFSYGNSTTDKSWGRIPDGGPISDQKLDPSPGSANQSPSPTPPSPTPPDPTAPPTDTPLSPTPTTVPLASTNTPTKKLTSKPTTSPTSSILGDAVKVDEDTGLVNEPTVPPLMVDTPKEARLTPIEKIRPMIPAILIFIGALFTLGAGVPLLIQEIRGRRKLPPV